jgi:hypothetical protein
MCVHDPVHYLEVLRPLLRTRAILLGVHKDDVDDLLSEHELRLRRACFRTPPVDEQHYNNLSLRILRGLIIDARRRRRLDRSALPEDDEGNPVDLPGSEVSGQEYALDSEQRQIVDEAWARALCVVDYSQYRGTDSRWLKLYVNLLVRRSERRPTDSMARHTRFLRWYFARYHSSDCNFSTRDESFAEGLLHGLRKKACYAGYDGRWLQMYDRELVRLTKQSDVSLSEIGRILKEHFQRHYSDQCDLHTRDRTFPCHRMEDIRRRLRDDDELRRYFGL